MILSIETSTEVCSVAIHDRGNLLDSIESTTPYSHAERLAPMIEELLTRLKIKNGRIKAVAVSAGPGSYTGLRIGTSTAKGLCYALDIPLIAVGTLESMLLDIEGVAKDNLLCPMIDARRMEVYCLLGNSDGAIMENVSAKIIDKESFQSFLETSKIFFYGNGAEKCKSVISNINAVFIDGISPNAKNIGQLANKKFLVGNFVDLAYFEPDYLKPYHAIKAKNPLL